MKMLISGKEYDLTLGFQKASLQTLYVLKKDYGLSVKDLEELGEGFEGKELDEVISDPDLLYALMAMIWMARRYAGEDLTLEEAGSFPLDEMQVVEEPAPEADPKEQTASVRAAAPPARPASSRKSKPRSTSTSQT